MQAVASSACNHARAPHTRTHSIPPLPALPPPSYTHTHTNNLGPSDRSLELRRATAVSLSEMEQRILLLYFAWEVVNLFLGGVLSGSVVR